MLWHFKWKVYRFISFQILLKLKSIPLAQFVLHSSKYKLCALVEQIISIIRIFSLTALSAKQKDNCILLSKSGVFCLPLITTEHGAGNINMPNLLRKIKPTIKTYRLSGNMQIIISIETETLLKHSDKIICHFFESSR
jgi:hypothetical protein